MNKKLYSFLRHTQRVATVGAVIGGMALSTCASAAPLTIVSQGKSTFTIVVPAVAAASGDEAAADLQSNIEEATGAKLPIVKDNEVMGKPFISLGSTKQAEAAGISANDIPAEGFRVVTRGNDLYIIGLDTTTVNAARKAGGPMSNPMTKTDTKYPEIPGPAFTEHKGLSSGTANGVYTFLENRLGVRWLMPGEIGHVMPKAANFTIPDINHTEAPGLISRTMSGMLNGPGVAAWRDRQKLGYSFQYGAGHSWTHVVSTSLYDRHPDWFAMNSAGKRPKPKAGDPYYKIEPTNPGVIKYFAEAAIKQLKGNPLQNVFSLSPSDGSGWSQSPESKALYDPAPAGKRVPSVSPMVVKFYNDVAAIVAREYPKGELSGYIGYTAFSNPPLDPSMKLPSNFVPSMTDGGFGYRYYDPEVRKSSLENISAWRKIMHPGSKLFYYCLPNWLRFTGGVIMPPAADNLNFLFHDIIDKNHVTGVTIYGIIAWDQAAIINYVQAKMLWNPKLDAKAVVHDWLINAYGPQAGTIMEKLYDNMDGGWFRVPNYNVTEDLFRYSYGMHYPAMEKLLLKAWEQPMTPGQKARLSLIRDNFIVLQWRLRNAGYLASNYQSPLTVDSAEINRMLADSRVPMSSTNNTAAFWKYFGVNSAANASPKEMKVLLGEASTQSSASPNDGFVLLYPAKDMTINIKVDSFIPGSAFLSYAVRSSKKKISSGLLYAGEQISFTAKANTPYYFNVDVGGFFAWNHQQAWGITIDDAALTSGVYESGTLTLQDKSTFPLYVYVPGKLSLESNQNGTSVVIQTPKAEMESAELATQNSREIKAAQDAALAKYHAEIMQVWDGKWKFFADRKNVGDAEGFYTTDFNDATWPANNTDAYWQENRYSKSFHGTAWYRKNVNLSAEELDPLFRNGRQLLLYIGAIEGDAAIYLNGQKIGQHALAEGDAPIVLDMTDMLHVGQNTIAIKVSKEKDSAGVYRGVRLLLGELTK